jgi:hypothetical protein
MRDEMIRDPGRKSKRTANEQRQQREIDAVVERIASERDSDRHETR